MKNTRLRTWYTFLVIIFPAYWFRTKAYDKEWDIWLWNALIDGKTGFIGRYEAIIDGKMVWIENHPYASGTSIPINERQGCSRVTSMLLRRRLPEARVLSMLKYGNIDSIWVNGKICM